MRIAIVDDCEKDRREPKDYVERYCEEAGILHLCSVFTDGDELLEQFDAKWDLVFLDIRMSRVDGIRTAERIRELDEDVLIVFVTSMTNMAIKGYTVRAFDFLIKPINYLVLKKLMSEAIRHLRRKKAHYMTIPISQGMTRINTEQILFVEVQNHDLSIVTLDQTYTIRSTMAKIETELAGEHFMRCHNCYLVNLSHVRKVDKGTVTVGDHVLAISRPRQKAFMMAMLHYIGGDSK